MPAKPQSSVPKKGGIHIGDVGGSVDFHALGDIVGGDKIVTINTTIQIAVEAVTQRPLITTSPYRGLDHFVDRDKDLFFGRDQLIRSLLAQLGSDKLLLVLGPSGSGKSSVVRAGLLPALSRLLGASFRSFTLVPDVNPFESLRSSFQRDFSQRETRAITEAPPHELPERIRSLQRSGEQWLLFVDQFEELFTRSDERFRADFIATLLGLAQDAPGTIKLVLAMRADFLDRFSAYPRFAARVEKNITLVAEMQADELRLAIEQPAAQHGVVFERGLVEEIIEDVQGQAGSLPLLQYTLDLLWEAERGAGGLANRHLNTQAYRELGGVRGALQKRADEIYAALGDGGEAKRANAKQEEVRRIFLRMVDIAGTGSDDAVWRPVRRRVAMSDFAGGSEQELLQHLIDQKLLVSGREGTVATVEVAHEALFTSWQRLRNWIEGGKQVIFVRNRLADDARRWEQRQRNDRAAADEELLGGSRLSQALEMQARGDFSALVGGLTEIEAQFLAASQTWRDRRLQEERDRQQRELAQAQALAAEQKQRADEQAKAAARQRKLALGMVGVAIATVLAALFAWSEKNKAQTADRIAVEKGREASHQLAEASWLVAQQARGLGAAGSAVSPFQATHYLFRAATALQLTGASAATRDALLAAGFSGPPIVMTLLQPDDERPAGAIYSPNGKTILTWTEKGTARLWRSDDGQPVGNPMRQSGGIQGAVFSPDGQRILTWDRFGLNQEFKVFEAQLWQGVDGRPVGEPIKHHGLILGGRFSPDGRRVLTWGIDGAARFWRATDGRPLGPPIQHGAVSEDQDQEMEPVDGAAFGPDGQWVITWSVARGVSPLPFGRRLTKRGRARVWRVEDNRITELPANFSGTVVGVCVTANDARLVTSSSALDNSQKFELQQWALPTGAPLGAPISFDGAGFRARVSDDGQHLIAWGGPNSATLDGPTSARLWRASDGQPVGQPIRLDQGVVDAQFSPDGERVLILMHDQPKFGGKWKYEAQLWSSVDGRALEGVMNHEAEIRSASFSPDGQRVMTRSDDGTVRIWRTGDAVPVEGPADNIYGSAGFNRDGTRLLVDNGKGVVRLLDTSTGAQVGPPLKPDQSGRTADFSLDGTRLLVWNRMTEVQFWEAQTAKPVGRPIQLGSVSVKGAVDAIGALAAFAPDSRHILTWNRDRGAQVWDADDGSPVGQLIKEGGRWEMQLSPDREQLLTWKRVGDGSVHFWRTRTGESLTLPLITEGIDGARFSPDGRHVVAWSSGGTIKTLRASDHELSGAALQGSTLSGVAFSSDSERIVTWGSDGMVKAWWTSNLHPIGMPLLHPAIVTGAMLSADAQRILTWSTDGAARLWSCESAQCIAVFHQPGGVAAACFNRAGTRVFTASIEGAVRQWDITIDDNISVAERIMEFEVRSATTLGADGQVRILRKAELDARKIQLAEMRKTRGAR